MCFLFGAVASNARKMEDMLISLRQFSNSNRDGWGIGWYTKKGPIVFKSTEQAIKDVKFARVSSLVNSNIVIAHLRAKTKGNLRKVNNQPFMLDEYLFAHNGTMDKEPLEKELKGKYRKLNGDTDSERLFYFLLQYINYYGSVHGMRRALKRIQKIYKEEGIRYMNILLSDGEYFFAFTKKFKRKGNGLYYLIDDGILPIVYVATKPIQEGNWEKLKDGELLIVDSKSMEINFVKF